MKRQELESAHPTKQRKLVIPRHKEIKEHLARSILRQAAADE